MAVAICLYWDDMTISGPDGTWVGAFKGHDTTTFADLGHGFVAFQQVLEGTSAYQGWTYVAHLLDIGLWGGRTLSPCVMSTYQ